MTEHELYTILRDFQTRSLDESLHGFGYDGSITDPFDESKITKHEPVYIKLIHQIFFQCPRLVGVHVAHDMDGTNTVIVLVADRDIESTGILRRFIYSCCSKELRRRHAEPDGKFGPSRDTVYIPYTAARLSIAQAAVIFGVAVPDVNEPDGDNYDMDDESEEIEIDMEDNPLALDFPPPTDID